LAPARDHYAKIVAKQRKVKPKPTSHEIHQVMLEDIFRK
jgi:hypothetical protein